MQITIIVGSHRPVSNSAKIGSIISEIISIQNPEVTIKTIDLCKTPLPIWDEKVWANDAIWLGILKPFKEILISSDAFVVISPEYCGMASPALKNFFLFWIKDTLAHKPAFLVGVSSTEHSGSYPIAELRMSSYKNSRILYIPDHVIVRSADQIPNLLSEISELEQLRTIDRLTHGVKILQAYSGSLKEMRANTDFEYDKFANGM